MISVQNENGEDLALYLKGYDESVVENTVVLMHSGDDAYVAPDGASISDDEPLLSLVFSQLPVSSTLAWAETFRQQQYSWPNRHPARTDSRIGQGTAAAVVHGLAG